MSEYALSTNLFSYAQARSNPAFFGWPLGTGEAEVIKQLNVGDYIIPKFSATPVYAGADESELEWQREYCSAIDVDYQDTKAAYDAEVAGGEGGVRFLLRVTERLPDDTRQGGSPWARVGAEKISLDKARSSKEFLLLRALPPTIAAQFKGTVSRGRH